MRMLASVMAWLRGLFARQTDPDEGWVALSNPITRAVDTSLALPVFETPAEAPAASPGTAPAMPDPAAAVAPAESAAAGDAASPASGEPPKADGAERAA